MEQSFARIIIKECARFEFTAAFTLEGARKEGLLVNNKKGPLLEPGTLKNLLEKYDEVLISNHTLRGLQVPKGVFRFYFYKRLTGIADVDGEEIEVSSRPFQCSPWYYLATEGELVTLEGLKRGEGFDPGNPKTQGYLLEKMADHDCDRIFRAYGGDGDFPLAADDVVIGGNEVVMVDTAILQTDN